MTVARATPPMAMNGRKRTYQLVSAIANRQPRDRVEPDAATSPARSTTKDTTGTNRAIAPKKEPAPLRLPIIPSPCINPDGPPNTGDKLRASNMLNARLLHPLVRRHRRLCD